jgi:hypothetical protein
LVRGYVSGPRGGTPLLLDTGAFVTLVSSEILDDLGRRDAEQVTSVTSTIGKEHG